MSVDMLLLDSNVSYVFEFPIVSNLMKGFSDSHSVTELLAIVAFNNLNQKNSVYSWYGCFCLDGHGCSSSPFKCGCSGSGKPSDRVASWWSGYAVYLCSLPRGGTVSLVCLILLVLGFLLFGFVLRVYVAIKFSAKVDKICLFTLSVVFSFCSQRLGSSLI